MICEIISAKQLLSYIFRNISNLGFEEIFSEWTQDYKNEHFSCI